MMSNEIISLEESLTARWQRAREEAEATIEAADHNLGRISLIYGGQLSFRLLEDDIRPDTAA